jgi:DNA-binding MarR family transcriptional regulator
VSATISAWLPEKPQELADHLSGLSGPHLLALAGSLIITQLTKALRAYDLQLSDWLLLSRLCAVGGTVSAGELATGAGVRASTVSTALARLSRQGLVTRQRPDNDQRTVHVHVTEAGRTRHATARAEVGAALSGSYGVLTPEADDVLRTLLTAILTGQAPN